MNPSKRFKKARENLGLTQHELAEKLGFKQFKIKDIETEKQKVSPEIAEDIERIFSINGWWLLTGKGDMFLRENEKKEVVTEEATTETVTLNYYEDVYAAAGYGAINDDVIAHPMNVDVTFLRSIIGFGSLNNLDVIQVVGDSMEPFIHNGETVIVQRTNEARNNQVVIARAGDEIYIKRILKDHKMRWIKLISDNKEYPNLDFNADEGDFEGFEILGVVKAKIRPF